MLIVHSAENKPMIKSCRTWNLHVISLVLPRFGQVKGLFVFSLSRSLFLEGFWVCGRVRGDRSVFVCCTVLHTHFTRVCFQLDQTLDFAFEVSVCCLHGPACLFLITPLRVYSGYAFTGYCLQFDQVFLSVSHLPPLVPRDHWTALTATLACPETVSK